MLTECVVIANAQSRRLAFVFQVLRCVTDDTAGVQVIVRAERRASGEIDVWAHDAMRSQLHAFIDDRVSANLNGGIQPRLRMHNGGCVDHSAASSHARSALSSQRCVCDDFDVALNVSGKMLALACRASPSISRAAAR